MKPMCFSQAWSWGIGMVLVVGVSLGVRAQSPGGTSLPLPVLLASPSAMSSEASSNSGSDAVPEAITRQRQAIAAEREVILTNDQKQQTACWQKFAVNACLSEARRARRQSLEPLRQQELALNAQERQWRTEQREKRLQGKQADTQVSP